MKPTKAYPPLRDAKPNCDNGSGYGYGYGYGYGVYDRKLEELIKRRNNVKG